MFRVINKTSSLDTSGLRKNVPAYLIVHSTRKYPTFESLYDHHKNDRRWNGVGYHFFFSEEGKVYQGRPTVLEGAHAIGFNTNSLGFCFYSKDGTLSRRKVSQVRDCIEELAETHELEVMSHTDAQIRYLNQLFKQGRIDYELPTGLSVVEPANFEKIKRQAEGLVRSLRPSEIGRLKLNIKDLKNCPGQIFKQLI